VHEAVVDEVGYIHSTDMNGDKVVGLFCSWQRPSGWVTAYSDTESPEMTVENRPVIVCADEPKRTAFGFPVHSHKPDTYNWGLT
jgi:hypothetical protein